MVTVRLPGSVLQAALTHSRTSGPDGAERRGYRAVGAAPFPPEVAAGFVDPAVDLVVLAKPLAREAEAAPPPPPAAAPAAAQAAPRDRDFRPPTPPTPTYNCPD